MRRKKKSLQKSRRKRRKNIYQREYAHHSGRNFGRISILLKKGRRNPLETLDELLHAAANGDGTADIVAEESEGCFSGNLVAAAAEEPGSAVVMLYGAKWMFGNEHPFLLF